MLEEVRIIEDSEKRDAIIVIEKNIHQLKELSETAEKWYGLATVLFKEKRGEFYKLMEDITSSIGAGSKELSVQREIVEDNVVNKRKNVRKAKEEDEEIAPEYQEILRHLKMHEPLIETLKFESSIENREQIEGRTEILRKIFSFLCGFVRNNKQNQAILIEDLETYISIMKMHPICGAEQLIEELFGGNRKLMRDSESVKMFTKQIMELVNELGLSNPISSKLMRSVLSYMKYKKQIIKNNQTIVLSFLTTKENQNIYFLLDDADNRKKQLFEQLTLYNDQVKPIIEAKTNGSVRVPFLVDYVASLLEVMAIACDGKNAVTESKCQSSWPIK